MGKILKGVKKHESIIIGVGNIAVGFAVSVALNAFIKKSGVTNGLKAPQKLAVAFGSSIITGWLCDKIMNQDKYVEKEIKSFLALAYMFDEELKGDL